jgi:hypothetical protein
MADEIGIRGLESGDITRVWLRPNSPSGTVDDLENPRRWRVVSNTQWERNESDSYFHDEENRRIHTRSVTYKATFSPVDSDEDDRFNMEYTIHRDGYTEYSPVKPENTQTPTHNIGRITRIETE